MSIQTGSENSEEIECDSRCQDRHPPFKKIKKILNVGGVVSLSSITGGGGGMAANDAGKR